MKALLAKTMPAPRRRLAATPRLGLARLGPFFLAVALSLLPRKAHAESWYRASFEGPVNASQSDDEEAGGTARIGPVGIDLSLSSGYEYNDNILLAPQAQVGTRGVFGAKFRAHWRASKIQELNLRGEFTQRVALSGPGKSQRYITLSPGSALRYNLFVKAVRVSAFLNLSKLRDPSASPAANNTETYAQSAVDGGLQFDIPFRGMTMQFLALRGLTTSSSLSQARISTQRGVISARLLRTFRTGLDGGIDAFLIRQEYQNGTATFSKSFSAGVFANSTVSQAMKVQASLSFDRVAYVGSRSAVDSTSRFGVHQRIEVTHRVRPNLTYTLRGERSLSEGVTSNYYQIQGLTLVPTFKVRPSTDLELEAGREKVVESLRGGEIGVRLNTGAALYQDLSAGLSAVVRIRRVSKKSNLPSRAYRQQVFEFTLSKDL